MFSKKFLNISEFAKISGVSRQTLIYYDRIGLFSPAVVRENGYRAYSHKQIDTICIITILKDLGVPLKKIKEILTDVTPERISDTLRYQVKVLKDRMEKLRLLEEMTEIRLEQLECGMENSSNTPRFRIREISEEIPFFFDSEIERAQSEVGDEEAMDLFERAEERGLPLIFAFGHLKRAKDIENGDCDEIVRMGFRVSRKEYANAFLPTGRYLVVYGKGDYGKTQGIYDALLRYVREHGYKMTGNVYEEYLIDELAQENPNEFVLQISVKIE